MRSTISEPDDAPAGRPFRRGLAARLVGLRQRKGWNQQVLADHAGVSRYRLAKWEAGRHAPQAEDLVALGKALEVSVDELLTGRNLLTQLREKLTEILRQTS